MGVFINFSNHPTNRWTLEQKNAAHELADCDTIIDLKFPRVPTDADFDEIEDLAFDYVDQIAEIAGDKQCYVMVQGEASLSCAVVCIINNRTERNIIPVCATSERLAEEQPDGVIKHRFEFVRFRRYCNL